VKIVAVEDALRGEAASLARHRAELVRQLAEVDAGVAAVAKQVRA
jgi:hypothetical protein